jgi:hypothetical protein
MSGSSVGSSREINSLVSFATAEAEGEKIEEFDKTMEKFDIEETVGQSYPSQKDFITKPVASPAIYNNYVSSSLKQQKRTTMQTIQQSMHKSTNQGAIARSRRRKCMSLSGSGESSCQPSIIVRKYLPIQEEKF